MCVHVLLEGLEIPHHYCRCLLKVKLVTVNVTQMKYAL